MFNFFNKRKPIWLTTEEKAVATKVVAELGVKHTNSVLEIYCGESLVTNGIFDKIGCYCKSIKSDNDFDEIGEFDFIFFINLLSNNIYKLLKNALNHVCENGLIAVLNTKKPLSNEEAGLLSKMESIKIIPLITSEFSLLIIRRD